MKITKDEIVSNPDEMEEEILDIVDTIDFENKELLAVVDDA